MSALAVDTLVDVPALETLCAATTLAAPTIAVSSRLPAPEPTWDLDTDVLVVGSGVAGLSVVRGLVGSGLRVHLLAKGELDDGSTRWAQGGIARACDDLVDARSHVQDTLVAGAGLCDPDAVRELVAEGPAAVAELAAAGARFDLGPDGRVALTREGGHSRPRIVHAGGDATGAEVHRALSTAAGEEGVTTVTGAFLLDLLRDVHGTVTGAVVALLTTGGRCRSVGRVHARATVLATGGLGQAFTGTTNPSVATGDGVAAAIRAGAPVVDLEFVQFHPTVLHVPDGVRGQRLLVSEALRGEGAVLRDAAGEPVMAGVHPLADLAPRDVVSATMAAAMAGRQVDHLFLDARGLGEQVLLQRFPTIVAGCRAAGVDPVSQPVPVLPAAHYSCGGIRADLSGRTGLTGLYAVGEVAGTGVHGANRLASNSLLEGLVAGRRLAALLRADLPPARRPVDGGLPGRPAAADPLLRPDLIRAMQRDAGVLREPERLRALADRLARVRLDDHQHGHHHGHDDGHDDGRGAPPDRDRWEVTNLHTVMAAIVSAAAVREESRGCHRRADVPDERLAWRRHLSVSLDHGDRLAVRTLGERP
jgi:L-aspartate oxidase